ncbi:MAG: IS110 family transposase [Leptolyngbyaceae cyanobacterium SU_3_3]|nr:IS110 family transposase [Leptolyngbyaceae cyanobacterium SU_3_3]
MKQDTKARSYVGKQVFIGIDVHKKTYTVVARVEEEVVKKWTTTASPQSLSQQLLKYFAGATIYSAYEAGFSGFVLHRELEAHGIENIVVNAAGIEVAVNDRVKTDKRDALKLATLLEAKRLKRIRIPSEEEEAHRLLSRTRKQLVEDCTAVKNKIRMKFHQFGLIDADETRDMTHKLVKELLANAPSKELAIVINAYWNVWKSLDEEIKKIEQELKQQAKEDPNEKTYRSAPGVGPQSARILSNELGNMSQFCNERQLFSYTGLTPSEYSSGEAIRRGHITHQGNDKVRGILIEIAWRAIEKDQALAQFFNRLFPRTGKKKAIVAVARKLIGRIRAAFQKGEIYQLGYPDTLSQIA